MTIDPRRSLLLPALVAVIAVVAACSSPSGAASPSAAPSVAASEAPSEAPASEPASEAPASEAPAGGTTITELKVAESTLGQIITDGAGMTLYGFTPDEAGTPTCYDDCAIAWPPGLADDPTAVTVGAGLDASKLSTVDRTDGGKQLKYGTWTLYYFANDAAAGDTKGQGLNEVWYAIAPSGELIK
jgi:predicted lipoprotein with Yx(FWY)xxD motif